MDKKRKKVSITICPMLNTITKCPETSSTRYIVFAFFWLTVLLFLFYFNDLPSAAVNIIAPFGDSKFYRVINSISLVNAIL